MTTTTIDIIERIRDFYRLDSIQCRLIGDEWSLIAWRTVAPSGYHSGRGTTIKAAVLELERSLGRSLDAREREYFEASRRVASVLPQTGGAEVTFLRKVTLSPAFDKRAEGCGVHGVHGVDMVFALTHPETKSAVTFQVYTGWMLPGVESHMPPCGASVDIHSPEPLHDHSPECTSEDCEHTGGKCWSDGSGLFANEAFTALVAGGDAAVWPMLQEFWQRNFDEES